MHLQNSGHYSGERLRKAMMHFATGRIAQSLARAVLLLILVRLLPLKDYGAYMVVVGLSEMMLQLASFGLLPVSQRFTPELLTTISAQKFSRFVKSLITLQWASLIAVVAILWQNWLLITPALGFSAEQAIASQNAVGLLLLVPTFRFAAELLETLLEQGRAQLSRALMPILRVLGIGIAFTLNADLSLQSILLIDIAATLACVLVAYGFLFGRLKRLNNTLENESLPLNDMLQFARHMWIVDLLSVCSAPGAIRMALGASLGIAASGLFAFLQSLERLISRYLPGTLLRGLIRPVMIDRFKNANGASWVATGMNLLVKCNLLIIAAAAILVVICGDELVAILSGEKFTTAGFTLFAMLLALMISSQRNVVDMIMKITRQTNVLRITALISPLILLLILSLPHLSLNIAILLLASGTAAVILINLHFLKEYNVEFSLDWNGNLRILIPAIVASLNGIYLATVIHPYAAVLASLSGFLIFLLLSRPLSAQEFQLIKVSLGKKPLGKKIAQAFSPFARKQTDTEHTH